MKQHLRSAAALGVSSSIIVIAACGSSDATHTGSGAGASGAAAVAGAGAGTAGNSGTGGTGSAAGNAASGSSGIAGSAGTAGGGGQPALANCTPPSDIDAPPEKLSQTGCMSATEATKFAARVIPYEVNSPLWSDGADKQRGMVIPSGQSVHIKDCTVETCSQSSDTGKWVFPVGTVMLKSFSFDNKLVETRLFVRHDAQTWVGYSYQWDEAQTDATIVPDDRRAVMFNTGTRTVAWNYPNRSDCMKCHNAAGGSTIGPQTRQMNRMVGSVNQIDTLKAMALFDKPPPAPYQAPLIAPYPGQSGSPPANATLEQKARSYMEANCAFCHRPDDTDLGMVKIDLRLDTAFKDMNLCNGTPVKGDQGDPSATLLTPGQPMKSIAWLRVNAQPGMGRMPQIGTAEVDSNGLALLGDWISSIQSCP